MIRQAGFGDFGLVWDMSVEFNSVYYDVPLSEDRLHKWFDRHIDEGYLLIAPGGYIAGLEVDDPVRDWTALVETGWYSKDGTGLRLLREFIKIGRAEGFDEVRMTTLKRTPARVLALLGRMKFEEVERSHRLLL